MVVAWWSFCSLFDEALDEQTQYADRHMTSDLVVVAMVGGPEVQNGLHRSEICFDLVLVSVVGNGLFECQVDFGVGHQQAHAVVTTAVAVYVGLECHRLGFALDLVSNDLNIVRIHQLESFKLALDLVLKRFAFPGLFGVA